MSGISGYGYSRGNYAQVLRAQKSNRGEHGRNEKSDNDLKDPKVSEGKGNSGKSGTERVQVFEKTSIRPMEVVPAITFRNWKISKRLPITTSSRASLARERTLRSTEPIRKRDVLSSRKMLHSRQEPTRSRLK